MATDTVRIRLEIDTDAGQKSVKDLVSGIRSNLGSLKGEVKLIDSKALAEAQRQIQTLTREMEKLKSAGKDATPKFDSKGLIALSKTLGQSYGEAEKFAKSLNLTGSAANSAFQRFGELRSAGANTIQTYQALTREFGLTGAQLKTLGTAYRELEVQQAVAAKTAAKAALDARAQQQAQADATARTAIAQAQALKNSSNEVTRLAQSFGGTYKQALELSRGLGLTAQESRNALTQLQQLRSVGATSSQAFNALQKELGITAQQFRQLETAAGQARGGVGGLNGLLTGVAQGIGQAGISAALDLLRGAVDGLTSAIADSVQTFAEYQFALADFASKTQGTVDGLQPLESAIREIAKTSTKTPAELAKTASTLVSLGASAEEAEARLRPITLLSDSLGSDVRVTGRVVQQAVQIFGDFGLTAEQAADQIQYFNDTTAIGSTGGIREFEKLFAQAGPAARAAGVDFRELASAFATLRAAGFSDRVASTSLKNSLLALSAPTDKAAVELRNLGVEAFDAQGNFKGLAQVYTDFAEALKGSSQEEQLRLAKLVFGREGASGFLQLTRKVSTAFVDTFNDAGVNSVGAVERRAAILNSSVQRLAENTKGSIETLVTDFGGALEPLLTAILTIAQEIGFALVDANSFDELTQASERFAAALKNDPELIQKITQSALALVETLDQIAAATVDALTTLAQSGTAENSITTLTEVVKQLANTIEAVITVARVGFAAVDPLISPAIAAFGLLYQGVNLVSDAINAVIDRFSVLGTIAENIPVLKELIRGKDAAEGFKTEVEKLPGAINKATGAIAPISEEEFVPDLADVEDAAKEAVKTAAQKAFDQNELFYAESQAQLEEALASRSITEEQYQEQSFQDEQSYLEKRIQLNRDRLTELKQLQQETSDPKELKKIQDEILDIEQKVLEDRSAIAKNAAEERERIEKEALDKIERANQEAADRIERAQSERSTAIRQAQLEGVISAEEADAQIREIEAQSSRETVAQKQRELEQVRQLRAQGTLSAEEAADKERELQGEIADLNLSALEAQIKAQEEARDAQITAIKEAADAEQRATDAAVAGYEQRLAAIDRVSDRLDFQNSLLESQSRLQTAINNLQQVESQGAIDRFNRALEIRQQLNQGEISSLAERRVLEQQLADLGFSRNSREIDIVRARQQAEQQLAQQDQQALAAQQRQARASLDLELRRQEIASRRAVIEAQIAEVQARQSVVSAQAALREAELSGDQNAIANAQAQADLAQQQASLSSQAVTDTQEQVTAQNALAENARRALLAEQQAEQVRQRNAALLSQMARDAERIQAAGARGNGLSAVQARKDGGPVRLGQPYLVGEEGPELILPRRSGYVLTAPQTAAIAANLRRGAGMVRPSVRAGGRSPDDRLLKEVRAMNRKLDNLGRPTETTNLNVTPNDRRTALKERARQLSNELTRRS